MTALLLCLAIVPAQASEAVIQFDLPPTMVAETVTQDTATLTARCELRISSLIATPGTPVIDQWLVQCQPRDPAIRIVDYAPKTEADSDVEGPIQIKISDEQTGSVGLSLDGNYGHSLHGGVGADRGSKSTNSRQYNMAAQAQTVTAAGTINRGRGVYFKLRRSAHQILEGEKVFQITLRVPRHWRGSLIDVSVVAQSERKSLGGWDRQVKTLGASKFVVAAYAGGDTEAEKLSRQLAEAEQHLQDWASTQTAHRDTSLPALLRQVAVKLELEQPEQDLRWIRRLMAGDADPYLDQEIQRLPMDVRIAVLEYCELREEFDRLSDLPPTTSGRLATDSRRPTPAR
jgi:hypothetical protein